jgi:hypothetical protein
MPHITLSTVTQFLAYWSFGWNALYALSPPREFFGNSPAYNKYLELVSYYGALNLRSLAMKAYGATPSDAPPIPPKADPAKPSPPAGP